MELAKDLNSLFDSYGAPVTVDRVEFTPQSLRELLSISSRVSIDDWSDPNVAIHKQKETKEALSGISTDLGKTLRNTASLYHTNGAVVISLGEDVHEQDINAVKNQLHVMLTALGQPFGAFHRKGFWQTLGVNPNASELRAESTGYIPLHIDFDQASTPPDGVALFCLRPDPYGGGESIVFDYQRFLNMLSDEDHEKLASFEYEYSTLFEQNGIGEVYNPHPLLDRNMEPSFLRYNGKVLPDLSGNASKLFTELEGHFHSCSTVFSLRTGDMIVVDQNKTLHGREMLANRSDKPIVLPEDDRFLLQTYIRHDL